MTLGFLQDDILAALKNLNENFISEIRLRKGQPVIIEYCGEYKYLYGGGITERRSAAITCGDVQSTLYRAMGGCVYGYAEQVKEGFITVDGGVRIGISGEYVTENGAIKTIKNASSLNVRIPHDVKGCSDYIFSSLLKDKLCNTLLYSVPGYGKTTMLRDLVKKISNHYKINVLVLDVRSEISGGNRYDLGGTVDVVLGCEKLISIKSAIRAMKPQLIITDELYGQNDISAMEYAADCGINIIASTHVCNKSLLQRMPFEYYVRLTGINCKPEIYDKNFDIAGDSGVDDVCGCASVCREKEKNENLQRTIRV